MTTPSSAARGAGGGQNNPSARAAPQQWRPHSAEAASWFQDRYCDACKLDAAFRSGLGDSCPIAAQGFGVAIGLEPPPEWVFDDGEPTCTAFDAEPGR